MTNPRPKQLSTRDNDGNIVGQGETFNVGADGNLDYRAKFSGLREVMLPKGQWAYAAPNGNTPSTIQGVGSFSDPAISAASEGASQVFVTGRGVEGHQYTINTNSTPSNVASYRFRPTDGFTVQDFYGWDFLTKVNFTSASSSIIQGIGLTNSTSDGDIRLASPTANMVGLQYNTDRGDTNYQFLIRDDTSTRTHDTGITRASRNVVYFRIKFSGTDPDFTGGPITLFLYDLDFQLLYSVTDDFDGTDELNAMGSVSTESATPQAFGTFFLFCTRLVVPSP